MTLQQAFRYKMTNDNWLNNVRNNTIIKKDKKIKQTVYTVNHKKMAVHL